MKITHIVLLSALTITSTRSSYLNDCLRQAAEDDRRRAEALREQMGREMERQQAIEAARRAQQVHTPVPVPTVAEIMRETRPN